MTRLFTGRHMLGIMLAFFGVIIAVNLVMATVATRTFGGKVVENSYVASQRFNDWLAEGRAQDRLGWSTSFSLDRARRITIAASTPAGALEAARIHAVARHPLGREPDLALTFRPAGGGRYVSTGPLPVGRWQVQFEIHRGDDVKRQIESLS